MKPSVELRIDTFSDTLGERLTNGTRPPPGELRLHWLGQAGFVIESHLLRWLIDPYLSDSLANKYRGTRFDHVRMMPAPIAPTALPPVDTVLCTHRHTDHMDPDTLQPLAAAQPALRFVVPAASRDEAARRCAVTNERLILAHVGQHIDQGSVAYIEPIASAHESLSVDASGEHEWLGYVMTIGGIRIYHSGDCIPYDGLPDLLRKRNIDIALLPVNGRDSTRQAGNIPGNFTHENLKSDLDNLYNTGVGLATAGIANLGDALLQSSSFHDLLGGKVEEIGNLYEHYGSLFEQAEHDISGLLIDMVGGPDNVAGLFNFSNYNLTAWMTDYLDEAMGNYYTQRWYIARRDQGSVSLCDYYPPTDDNSILNGGAWVRFNTSDPNFYPDASQREQVLANSEGYAGWSRNRVQQLNNQNDGFSYSINYWMSAYIISKKNKQTKKAYAYEIHVSKNWNKEEVVYEEVFDSYSMDLNTFRAQLNVRLAEFNENEDGYTYYISSGARNYYQATDAAKLKGCESVTISVTCSDGVTLGQGSTQYKCRKCGSSLNAHTKECAMQTSVTENDLDLSELDALLNEANSQAANIEAQIGALENENAVLLKKISTASIEDAANYRQQYNANKTRIDRLKGELAEWKKKQSDYAQAKSDAADDNSVATDDYYRIPAIMQDCKAAYGLTWQDGGAWNGYSYVRKATMPNINGIITFRATVSIARKPKYFLGIKIHRTIIQIKWELTSEYTDTHVADVLTLDPGLSDAEKAKLVNDRIAEIAREHPSCKITTEYARSAPTEETPSGDVYHLLWSSDRLEIAREVDSRITKIYADLVSLEKMMHYKRSILDVMKDVQPGLDTDEGRRLTLVEECHDRWVENARTLRSGNSRNSRKEVRP